MSARLMQTGAGTIALIAAGIIIVAVGGYHVYK
jgi:LPXTG-motif cell wall-anchored protein